MGGLNRIERLQAAAPAIIAALDLGLRPAGAWLRGPSPLRPNSANPRAFSLSAEHGGWRDWPEDESGDLFELLARLWNLDRRRDFLELLDRAEALAGIRGGGWEATEELPPSQRPKASARSAQAAAQESTPIKGSVWRNWTPESVGREFARFAALAGERERDFLAQGYGIPEFPANAAAPWTYPRPLEEINPAGSPESRQGLLYIARDEKGQPEAIKFKSFARTTARSKRASRGVWGSKAALLGADLLPNLPDAGGIVAIVGGEEKALAGNAWAARLGLPVVFVSALFGEGFHRGHGPAQARRVMKVGPQRIILAGDADAAGEKFNAAWQAGLLAAGWPAQRIGAVAWPQGSSAGYDANDFLLERGPEALLALVREAPAMAEPQAPPASSPARPALLRGAACRRPLPLDAACEPFRLPEPVRLPLAFLRCSLSRRLETMKPGEKLLLAAGTGTGKSYAAAAAVEKELRRRVRPDMPPPRVLIVSQKSLWKEWRKEAEKRGIKPSLIAELPGREGSNCRHAGMAASLRQKGQHVGRLLCGRNSAGPEGQTAEGGEAWTPCAALAQRQAAAEQGVKAEPGCQGCAGELGYILQYEKARAAQVVLTTPERLFGVGFDRLEGSWPFTLIIIDEGIDRCLLGERRVPARVAEQWRRRLDALQGGPGAADLPNLGGLSLSQWLDRLLAIAPHRAKLLETDRLARLASGRSPANEPGRTPERDAWLAWAVEAWGGEEPNPEARRQRLLGEIRALLAALGASATGAVLPFERAQTASADAPHAAFRDYFESLKLDLEAPQTEPWLLSVGSGSSGGEFGPDWIIAQSPLQRLAILGDPTRKVAILDATPNSASRVLLAHLGFKTFEALPRDDTRIIQALGFLNGTGHLSEPEPQPPAADAESEVKALFEKRLARWKEARRRHEERIVQLLVGLGFDPADARVITHKARAQSGLFEQLAVGATFGQHRGTNALKDVPVLLIDGRSEPPAEVMARERRLLGRALAAFGAPEPPLHPLIARSRPDNRPGLTGPRRHIEYVSASESSAQEVKTVSVPSAGDDAVDSWILESREREMIQCVGRLRGPDRAASDQPPGVAIIITNDPLGLVPVHEFVDLGGEAESLEAARVRWNQTQAEQAAARDAQRVEEAERAAAEMRLSGQRVTQASLARRVNVAKTALRRAFERQGLSLSELCEIGEELRSTLAIKEREIAPRVDRGIFPDSAKTRTEVLEQVASAAPSARVAGQDQLRNADQLAAPKRGASLSKQPAFPLGPAAGEALASKPPLAAAALDAKTGCSVSGSLEVSAAPAQATFQEQKEAAAIRARIEGKEERWKLAQEIAQAERQLSRLGGNPSGRRALARLLGDAWLAVCGIDDWEAGFGVPSVLTDWLAAQGRNIPATNNSWSLPLWALEQAPERVALLDAAAELAAQALARV